MISKRWIGAAVALVVAASGMAACGSSDDESSASSSTSSTSAAVDAAGSGVASAQKELAPLLRMPTSIGITEPLKGSARGKTVDFVECGITECKLIGDFLSQASKNLGITVKRIPAGNTPESMARAWDQAVANHADGVLTVATPKAQFSKQLAKLEDADIPVVSMATADPAGNGLSQVLIGPDTYRSAGKNAANWVTVDSKGKAKALLVTVPVFPSDKPITAGFSETMEANCAGCTFHAMGVSPDDIGKGVPGQIVSYLQQHPDTDYVVTVLGSLMIGVPAAVRAAGLQDKVTLFTIQAGQAEYQNIEAGQMKATVAGSSAFLGWMAADQIARAMTGQDPTTVVDDAKLPWYHVFTKDDITWDPNAEPTWPYISGFQEQFKKLWARG